MSLPWRPLLAAWPDEWRERWGHRANALEDAGVGWVEAERQAWNEVLEAKRDAAARVPERVGKTTAGTLFQEAS